MRLRALILPPLVIALLWAGLVWWPSGSMISNENAALEAEQERQLSLLDEIDDLNRIAAIAEDLERDLISMDVAVPASPAVDAFISDVASDAERSGVAVRLLSPTDVLGQDFVDPARPVPAGMTAVSILIAAEGEFEAVMAFVDRLDAGPRLVVVDGLTIATVDGGPEAISVEATVRIFNDTGAAPTAATRSPEDDLSDAELVDAASNDAGRAPEVGP